MPNRNIIIDYMRAGALALIILAHVNTPSKLMEFRCFDVIMLVFLAGFSYRISTEKKKKSYVKYIWNRIKKLLFPTWAILTLIFVSVFLIFKSAEPIGIIKMIESYLLYDGIGYVWFVRVMLSLAIVSPILKWLSQQIDNNDGHFFVLLLIWCIIYWLMLILYNAKILPYWINLYYYLYPVYVIGYGLIYFLGIHYSNLSGIMRKSLFLIAVCLTFALKIFMNMSITDDKYPPGALYISYGLMWTIGVYETLKKMQLKKCPKIIQWVSQNSFTIYLVHIIPILIVKYLDMEFMKPVHTYFIVEYIYLIITTIILIGLLKIMKSGFRKVYNGRK